MRNSLTGNCLWQKRPKILKHCCPGNSNHLTCVNKLKSRRSLKSAYIYDPVAKQELVQSCLQPGVSIARQALDHGVNANLLRKWINHYQAAARDNPTDQSVPALPAFVPVLTPVIQSQANATILTITLVNGVQMMFQAVALSELSPLLTQLADLPCSASTQR